jgi:pimeloyl-ACP methyl ester carboxylesterase
MVCWNFFQVSGENVEVVLIHFELLSTTLDILILNPFTHPYLIHIFSFSRSVFKMNPNQAAMCNRLIDGFEKRLGHRFRRNSEVLDDTGTRKILLTLDPITIYHKPLAHYILVQGIHLGSVMIFSALGFKRYQGSAYKIPFYYRKGSPKYSNSVPKPPPLVFFHGLGIGLSAYVPLIGGLVVNQPQRTIVLFEMPSISMRLDDNHILPEEYANHVQECLTGLGLGKCIIAGHSVGTACVRWMDLYHPDIVLARIFIDPICFSLWTHHTAHNALYRTPKNLNEAFIKYVGMSEAGIATFLHRYFVWFQNTYFTSQLPSDAVIYLAERDDIISAQSVLAYLQSHPHPKRKVVYVKKFHHGQLIASIELIRIIDEINAFSHISPLE